jgi:hypothetical protein
MAATAQLNRRFAGALSIILQGGLLFGCAPSCTRPAPRQEVESAHSAPATRTTRPAPPVGATDKKIVLLSLASQVLGQPHDTAPIRRQITDAIDRAEGVEKTFLKRLLGLLNKMSDSSAPDPNSISKEMAQLLRDVARAMPENAEVQRKVAASLFSLGTTFGREPPGPELRAEGIKRYQLLAKELPDDVQAHYGLGHAVFYGKADERVGLRAVKRCLKLQPDHEGCKKIHGWLAESYVRPYCSGDAIPSNLEVVHAWIERSIVPKGISTTQVVHDGRPLFAAAKPVVLARHVSRLAQLQDKGVLLQLNESVTYEQLAPFRAWAPQEQRALLMLGKKVVLVSEGSPLYGGDDLAFLGKIEKLCRKVSRRDLPKDLR